MPENMKIVLENFVREESQKGNYVGRKEIFDRFKEYFVSLGNPDIIDSEIKGIIEKVNPSVQYMHCRAPENYCLKFKKIIQRKECKKNHDYFTNCTKVFNPSDPESA